MRCPQHVLGISGAICAFCAFSPLSAQELRVLGLGKQAAGADSYFLVKVEAPATLQAPPIDWRNAQATESRRRELARLPRLVPQDRHSSCVYAVAPTTVTDIVWQYRRFSALAFGTDGKTVAAGCEDGMVLFWNPETDKATVVDPGRFLAGDPDRRRGRVRQTAFSPDGKTLGVLYHQDSLIRLWDLETGVERPALDHVRKDAKDVYYVVDSFTFCADGKTLASASVDGSVILWDLQTGKERASYRRLVEPDEGRIQGIVVSPDGKKAAVAGSADPPAVLWDLAGGKETAIVSGKDGGSRGLAFSPDGRTLALDESPPSSREAHRIKLLDTATGRETAAFTTSGTTWHGVGLAFSPDGKKLAIRPYGAVEVWDLAARNKIGIAPAGLDDAVWGVQFNRDASLLAGIGNYDESLRLLEVATGKLRAKFRSQSSEIDAIQVAIGDLESGQRTGAKPSQLVFIGKVQGAGPARFRLIHETASGAWAEHELALDFTKAKEVEAKDQDLRKLWARAQANEFALKEAQTADFGFYAFARAATGRKYGFTTYPLVGGAAAGADEHRRLYEMTTGASAIAESLAVGRMLGRGARQPQARTVPIAQLRGVEVAEHPWEKMLAGKKPAPEPLAKLIPHDNYYIHFKSIKKFIELGELMDDWGTNLIRAYELNSRDGHLKQRYERQLCLKSTWLGKTLGPAVIKGLAVTGNDPYVREGTDVTVVFQVVSKELFLAAVDPFLQEARREFAAELKETKSDYRGIAVESFVTPLREVSLHRASFGNHVVYSNSPAGIRRVIDTHQGRLKPLADSLDFQYMRTVFRADDKEEDGFAFLSDAFIRQLVGPASRIKEKRRLEALTSLYMLTHGAMLTAWETGKLPGGHDELLAGAALKADDIYVPEGKPAAWEARRQAAVSDAYNTIQFATPLIELTIDKVSIEEQRDYEGWRGDYVRQWRQYFDPIGMRLSFTDKQLKLDTYILPLIENSAYNWIRQSAGGGTATLDPRTIPPTTLFQFLSHIAPEHRGDGKKPKIIGDWLFIRLDDSKALGQLVEVYRRHEGRWERPWRELERTLLQMPWVFGVQIGDEKTFDDCLKGLQDLLFAFLGPATIDAVQPAHRGVTITRIELKPTSHLAQHINENTPKEKLFIPRFYHAKVEGAWYFSCNEQALKRTIDRCLDLKEGKLPAQDSVATNNTIYLAPQAAVLARDAVRLYLEWESQRRALANSSTWYALYRCGLVPEDASDEARRKLALRFIGFEPVSPDGAPYKFDPKAGEVVNARHGSYRQPRRHEGIAADSPLARLLDQFRTIRADLRFREDGIHTVLTIDRKAGK